MKEKLARIGQTGGMKTDSGFYVNVKILDYKNSYGRDRWLVTPVSGAGEAWVENIGFDKP